MNIFIEVWFSGVGLWAEAFGGRIFDCALVVTAQENGVEMIYTENVEDFEGYGFLRALNPLV